MQLQQRLAAVADRTVADLLGELCAQVEALGRRVAVLEGGPPADGVGGDVDDGPDALALALNGRLAALLVAGGYGSLAAVRAATDADLLAVRGVDARALRLIRTKIE